MSKCLCGCGSEVRYGSKFVSGHNSGIPGYWKNGMKGKHFSEETRKKMSEHRKGRPSWKKGLTMENDTRIKSSWNKGLPKEQQPGYGQSSPFKGAKRSLEIRHQISEGKKKYYKENPDCRAGERNTFYGKKHSEDFKIRHSQNMKKKWEDSDFASKSLERQSVGMNVKPNKPEIKMMNILNNYFPNCWEYVGDGKVWIGSRNPDFIMADGSKAVIEVFGDFWHANPNKYKSDGVLSAFGKDRLVKDIWERDENRIQIFQEHGYECLVIWESELNNLKSVIESVGKFATEVNNV